MTTELVAERRRALVKALRSGEFRQTRGRLRRGSGYCCLGVAEQLRGAAWIPDAVNHEDDVTDGDYVVLSYGVNVDTYYLSDAGMAYYGFLERDPRVVLPSGRISTLSTLNDQARSFDEIAAVIEAQSPQWDGTLAECERRGGTLESS